MFWQFLIFVCCEAKNILNCLHMDFLGSHLPNCHHKCLLDLLFGVEDGSSQRPSDGSASLGSVVSKLEKFAITPGCTPGRVFVTFDWDVVRVRSAQGLIDERRQRR